MARIQTYDKATVTLFDKLVGTDVENKKNTVNIPVAAIIDLAADYIGGGGTGSGTSLLSITTSIENNSMAIAAYSNQVYVNTSETEAVVRRTERIESVFEVGDDDNYILSAATIFNLAETVASQGFASATQVQAVETRVDQIVDGELVLSTYATNTLLQTTVSTLNGSIATTRNELTTAYEGYVDGRLESYSTSLAVQELVSESTADLASARSVTELDSSLKTYVGEQLASYSDTTATNLLITEATADKATAQSVTQLDSSLRTYVGEQLESYSTTTATSELITKATADKATAESVTKLDSSLKTYVGEQLSSYSDTTAVNSLITTATDDLATAESVTDLGAKFGTFDEEGNLTGISEALSSQVSTTVAGDGYASSSDLTTLQSTVGGNTSTLTTQGGTIADIEGNLQASYGINLDVNGNIASMSLLSDSETGSAVSFNSDVFTINVNGQSVSPFVVSQSGIALNGEVTFSSNTSLTNVLSSYLSNNNYATTSDIPEIPEIPDVSGFIDTTELAQYLQDQGYETGSTAGITETALLNILNGTDTTVNTVINGGTITTGIIANATFAMPSNSALSGFSSAGMGINLDNGSIHAEQFYINSNGTANFGGAHSAGSIGNWTVDSSGALKSGNSSIVLSPTDGYSEIGSEKLILSSEDLPAIAPAAGVSANFHFASNAFPSGISSTGGKYRKTSSAGGVSASGRTSYEFASPDTAFIDDSLNGVSESSNITYNNYKGGNAAFSIPYRGGPSYDGTVFGNPEGYAFSIDVALQKQFGKDYLWPTTSSGSAPSGGGPSPDGGTISGGESTTTEGPLDYNNIPSAEGVITYDYSLKIKFDFYFVSTGGGVVPVDLVKSVEKVLISGSVSNNLNEASPNVLVDYNSIAEYFGIQSKVPGNWEPGQIQGSLTNMGTRGTTSNPGNIKVVAKYVYQISNFKVVANFPVDSDYILNDSSNPWVYLSILPSDYNSSGTSTNSLSNVLFTGATSKTSIGLNGMQVRGDKGFVALGDVVDADAVAQVWGNAQVFGALTTNVIQSFSDKNLKNNITPIQKATETVSKLKPVSFNWNPDIRGVDLQTKYGFIAQDVQEILPSIVKENEHLVIEHNNIISINTAAIQELIDKINELEQEVKKLKENNG